jgi:hypothetical protein
MDLISFSFIHKFFHVSDIILFVSQFKVEKSIFVFDTVSKLLISFSENQVEIAFSFHNQGNKTFNKFIIKFSSYLHCCHSLTTSIFPEASTFHLVLSNSVKASSKTASISFSSVFHFIKSENVNIANFGSIHLFIDSETIFSFSFASGFCFRYSATFKSFSFDILVISSEVHTFHIFI